jgi:putative transposase
MKDLPEDAAIEVLNDAKGTIRLAYFATNEDAKLDLKEEAIPQIDLDVLKGEIAERLRELIRQTCAQLDVYILAGHVSAEHVHLLVSAPPHRAVSDLMQRIKGRSSRKLLEEFGELSRQYWGRHLWARGYFAVSSGNVTDDVIKEYIESHRDKPSTPDDDNFSL